MPNQQEELLLMDEAQEREKLMFHLNVALNIGQVFTPTKEEVEHRLNLIGEHVGVTGYIEPLTLADAQNIYNELTAGASVGELYRKYSERPVYRIL